MKMKNSVKPSKKGKGIAAGLVVCFVAAIAAVGTYTLNHYQSGKKQEMAKTEEQFNTKEEQSQSTSVDQDMIINEPQLPVQEEPEIIEETPAEEAPVQEKPQQKTQPSYQLNFNEKELIQWPVDGEVILSYSMDKTVYFQTLDQYKYNPALIIGGKADEKVMSAARGIVKSIDVTAQTGTTVTVDLGNGYEAVYGQLQKVPVKTGDYVEAKTVLGHLAEPTKYYVVEGCNLYFAMKKDGQPINPLEYLGE